MERRSGRNVVGTRGAADDLHGGERARRDQKFDASNQTEIRNDADQRGSANEGRDGFTHRSGKSASRCFRSRAPSRFRPTRTPFSSPRSPASRCCRRISTRRCPKPVITSVVSAADGTSAPASGGLSTSTEAAWATGSAAAPGYPLPTLLGQACVTVNNITLSLFSASPSQLNRPTAVQCDGQRHDGGADARRHSDPFTFVTQSTARRSSIPDRTEPKIIFRRSIGTTSACS